MAGFATGLSILNTKRLRPAGMHKDILKFIKMPTQDKLLILEVIGYLLCWADLFENLAIIFLANIIRFFLYFQYFSQ